jgi:hypothetical protein
MAVTYEPIASTTLVSTAATVTFSSISGAYTDLILVMNAADTTSNANAWMNINSDTGSNYSRTNLLGDGSTGSSTSAANQAFLYLTPLIGTGTDFGTNWIVQFMNYSNTTTYKTILYRANQASGGVVLVAGLWKSTSAINSLDIKNQGTAWKTGSTFTLYGILKA